MKLLKICKNRQEAEAIIQRLKTVRIIAVIKAVAAAKAHQDSELQLMVDEQDWHRAQDFLVDITK